VGEVSQRQGSEERWQPRLKPLLLRMGILGVFLLLLASLALCQSCALCYTQAAGSGSRMIEALRSGILILIVPPTLMSAGVILVAYAKRNQFRRTDVRENVSGGSDTYFYRNSDGFGTKGV
jgi:hypothetical protein